jgi:hypothetical protein
MSERPFDALASVRLLIKTGNNKRFWRKRERELLAEIEAADLRDCLRTPAKQDA